MKNPLPPAPNLGTILNTHMRRHRYYKSALARDIGVNYKTVVRIMRRPDISASMLWNICFALNYNFLSELAGMLPPTMPAPPTPKDTRIAELEAQVQQLTSECNTLQRIIDALKDR